MRAFLSCRVPTALLNRLRAVAKEEGTTITEIVLRAIRCYL